LSKNYKIDIAARIFFPFSSLLKNHFLRTIHIKLNLLIVDEVVLIGWNKNFSFKINYFCFNVLYRLLEVLFILLLRIDLEIFL